MRAAPDALSALLAQAQAGTLSVPDVPFPATVYQTVTDPNKAVVSAHARQDTALMESLLHWHEQQQQEAQEAQAGEAAGGERTGAVLIGQATQEKCLQTRLQTVYKLECRWPRRRTDCQRPKTLSAGVCSRCINAHTCYYRTGFRQVSARERAALCFR